MNKITCIIIDDETATINVLGSMLQKHCPVVEMVGHTSSADEGYGLISEINPQLVFLDIKMPGKTGFDLLRMFDDISFNVIFVSAFDQYAIQAFEFNALDYILKPVDHSKLTRAVDKVKNKIGQENNNNIIHFIHSLDEKSQLIKRISLHHNEKVYVVDINEICYVQASRGYSEIVTINNQRMLSSKTLSDYEELLSAFPYFLRVNKSIIVNINFIKDYTKGSDCFITLKNRDDIIEVSRRKKTDIIQYLRRQS